MKGNQGIWVAPYKEIKPAAVALKIGVAHDHKKGTAKVEGRSNLLLSANAAVAASCAAAILAWFSC
jgi:hypothetical protein